MVECRNADVVSEIVPDPSMHRRQRRGVKQKMKLKGKADHGSDSEQREDRANERE